MATARRRRAPEEEHENHERWMVTYADMVTLLMVLFIVMFAISQVDQKRFEMLKDGMAAGFGHTSSPFQGSQAVMPEPGTQPITPLRPMSMDGPLPANSEQLAGSVAAQDDQQRRLRAGLPPRSSASTGCAAGSTRRCSGTGLRQDVRMKIDSRGLTISLVSKHIVFRAERRRPDAPRGDGARRGRRRSCASVHDRIDIDGHTNQVKVQPKFYATDWDLSAARAVTVLRYLERARGHRR